MLSSSVYKLGSSVPVFVPSISTVVVKYWHYTTTYTMRGNRDGEDYDITLEEHEVEKDLGVYVDNSLNFKEHVAKSTAKANRVVGIIRRTFDFLSEDLFVLLYKSLVRPILEYGHSVWQPQHKTLCSDIEGVQRRATRLLSSIRDKPYPERLTKLKLPSLEHRRRRGDMIDLWKYMHGLYDVDRPRFTTVSNRDHDTRGNSLKLLKRRHQRLTLRSNSFSYRVVNLWNNLPDSVVRHQLSIASKIDWISTGKVCLPCTILSACNKLV